MDDVDDVDDVDDDLMENAELEIKSEAEGDDDGEEGDNFDLGDDDDDDDDDDDEDDDDFEAADFDDDFDAPKMASRRRNPDGVKRLKTRNRRSVVKLMSIDRKKSQVCSFCNDKFDNFLHFSNHILDQHPEKLDERQRLIVSPKFLC